MIKIIGAGVYSQHLVFLTSSSLRGDPCGSILPLFSQTAFQSVNGWHRKCTAKVSDERVEQLGVFNVRRVAALVKNNQL